MSKQCLPCNTQPSDINLTGHGRTSQACELEALILVPDSCVTLGKLCDLFEPLFPILKTNTVGQIISKAGSLKLVTGIKNRLGELIKMHACRAPGPHDSYLVG